MIQLRNTSTKSTSVIRESATRWPGRSTADSLTMRRRTASNQPPSAVGFRRSTDGSNSSTLPRKGRATVKLPQIIVIAQRLECAYGDARCSRLGCYRG